MTHLLGAALIWAFSFGLIKNRLATLDSNFVAAARLLISLLVLLPWLRPARIPPPLRVKLVAIGAIQYGLMYLSYVAAFRYLRGYEVALFTVTTPIYVTLVADLFERRLRPLNLLTATLAVLGSGIACYGGLSEGELLAGALLIQVSNLCFAFGQVAYKRWLPPELGVRDHQVFAWLYLGGFVAAGLAAVALADWRAVAPNGSQLLALLYLGVVASGLAFFLWNRGARRVEVGTLAVFNNLKIPLAVAASVLVFGEQAKLANLLVGGSLVLGTLALQNLLSARSRGA